MPSRRRVRPRHPISTPAVPRPELAAVAFGVLIIADMTALAWYGVDHTRGRGVTTLDAWRALPLLSWLAAAMVAAVVASAALHFSQRTHGVRTATGPPLALLSLALCAAFADRVLVALPEPHAIVDQKLGAIVGLALVLGLTVSNLAAARAGRPRRTVAARAEPQEPGQPAGAIRPGHEPGEAVEER